MKNKLTKTEIKILGLIAQGYTDKEISKIVARAKNTIHVHNTNIKRKLGVDNRVKMAIYAIKNGIVKI